MVGAGPAGPEKSCSSVPCRSFSSRNILHPNVPPGIGAKTAACAHKHFRGGLISLELPSQPCIYEYGKGAAIGLPIGSRIVADILKSKQRRNVFYTVKCRQRALVSE